jgi:hypothetical protein
MYVTGVKSTTNFILNILNLPSENSSPQVCLTATVQLELIVWSKALLEKLTVTQLLNKFPFFMETEGSLPCSQKSAYYSPIYA